MYFFLCFFPIRPPYLGKIGDCFVVGANIFRPKKVSIHVINYVIILRFFRSEGAMSNRSVKWLEKQKALKEAEAAEESGEEVEEEAFSRPTRRNIFDFFDDDEEADNDSEDEQNHDEGEVEADDEVETPKKHEERAPKPAKGKGKSSVGNNNSNNGNKKRKKGKRGKKQPVPKAVDPNPKEEIEKEDEVVEEKETPKASTKKKGKRDGDDDEDERTGKKPFEVSVNPKFFDPDREMAKMFGRDVVMAATPEVLTNSAAASAAAHRRGRYQRGPKEIVMRRAYWPPLGADPARIEMEQTSPGVFRYVHPRRYAAVQHEFDATVQTYDPEGLVLLQHEHPWHIDTLLQLSLLHMQLNEEESAEDMVCRCIYALQGAFHHAFTLTGTSALPYSVPENRPLFIALFRYAGLLGRRGCSRTALEVAKLLFSLDSTDPLGAVFLLDYYAVRSGEFPTALALARDPRYYALPNVLFSAALARRMLRQPEAADAELDRAIALYPLVIPTMLEMQGVSHEHADLLAMKTYDTAALADETPEPVSRVAEIFCTRSHDLWKDPAVTAWLTARAAAVARRLESAEADGDEGALALLFERKQTYLHANEILPEVYRHLIVTDFADAVARIPRDALAGAFAEEPQERQEAPVRRAPTNNILGLFLYTLLPWVQVPNAPQDDPDSDNED